MTSWNSPSDIAREFGLDAHASDVDSLRKEIRKLISANHPDKNNGQFKTEKEKNRYLRLQQAIEFLNSSSQRETSVIPVSQLPALVTALTQALATQSPRESIVLQSTYLSDARSRIAKRFSLPKIGSGVFAAITGFLVTFGEKFEKHPILGPQLNNPTTQMLLFLLIVYSTLFFVLSWYRERQAEAKAEFLLSESVLRDIYTSICHTPEPSGMPLTVTSMEILRTVEMIAGYRGYRNPLDFVLFQESGVDLPTIEKAVAVQTQRLIERKLLTRIDTPSIDTLYEVHRNAQPINPADTAQRR